MAIPPFNEKGLLPEGIYPCTLEEAQERFATSEHRTNLWSQLTQVIGIMKEAKLSGILLIDGSYVTDKTVPGDIDTILDVSNEPLNSQVKALVFKVQNGQALKEHFHVDWWVNMPAGNQNLNIPSGNDFSVFFQYARASEKIPVGTKKGILRIESWN